MTRVLLSVLSFINTLHRFASSLKHERSSWTNTKKSRIPFLCNFFFVLSLLVCSFVRCGLVTQYYLCWIKQKTCPHSISLTIDIEHWTFTTTTTTTFLVSKLFCSWSIITSVAYVHSRLRYIDPSSLLLFLLLLYFFFLIPYFSAKNWQH